MVGGLKEVDEELRSLEIPFEVLLGKKGSNPGKTIAEFASEIGAGCVVTDFRCDLFITSHKYTNNCGEREQP